MEFIRLVTFLCIISIGHGEVDRRFSKFEKCLANLATDKLFGPHSDQYKLYNFQSNKEFPPVSPIAIFTPSSSKDVQKAVKCGVRTNTQLVPISGGHSYAGLSSGTNDSIQIDFRLMNTIDLNSEEKTVTVGPGVMLGHLYFDLWKKGKFGVAGGACTTVAMGGLAIGGGIGYFSTHFGLVIDNLLQMNMVDAKGKEVLVNPTTNVDLWWAMRGVGPGYIGLVTSFKMKVFPAGNINIKYLDIRIPNSQFRNVMGKYVEWLEWVKKNDPKINTLILVQNDEYEPHCGGPDVSGTLIHILKIQDQKTNNEHKVDFVDAALKIFAIPSRNFTLTDSNFIDYLNHYSYQPSGSCKLQSNQERLEFFSNFTRESDKPKHFLSKSFFVKKSYNAKDFNEIQNVLLNMKGTSGGLLINSEQGAIGRPHSNESVYVHRDALFHFKIFVSNEEFKDDDAKRAAQIWMGDMYNSVKFMDSGETYQNYPERDLKDYLRRYYGSNLERLIEIKRKWDPNNFFNSKMSLPLSLSSQKLT